MQCDIPACESVSVQQTPIEYKEYSSPTSKQYTNEAHLILFSDSIQYEFTRRSYIELCFHPWTLALLPLVQNLHEVAQIVNISSRTDLRISWRQGEIC